MPKPSYSPFQIAVHRLVSRPAFSHFLARNLHKFDTLALKLSGGRQTLTGIFTGLPVLVLHTFGAKSGLPRRNPLVYLRDDQHPGSFALVASNFGQRHSPAWYYNLKAEPHCTCEIDGHSAHYVAREASGAEYDRFWQQAQETYMGYALYQQRTGGRHIPILILSPE